MYRIRFLVKENIYILILFAIFFFVCLGIHFNGLYGQDGYEYLRYAGRLRNFILNGENPGDYFWPVGYPLYGALFSFLFNDVAFSLQLVSFFGLISCYYFGVKIISICYDDKKSIKLYLFLFLLLSPLLLRSSLLVMSDVASAGFIVAAFYYSLRYSKDFRWNYFLLFSFCFANAIMFRYAAAVLLFPVALWTGINWLTQKKIWQLLFAAIVMILIFLPHYLVRTQTPLAFLNHEWLQEWSFRNFFSSQFNTPDGILTYRFPNILFSLISLFHPGYFIAGFVFLYFKVKKGSFLVYEKWMIVSIFIYLLFLMGTPLQNQRFFIVVLPFFIIICFGGYQYLFAQTIRYKTLLIGFVILFQATLFTYVSQKVYRRNQLELTIFNYLNTIENQKNIYSFDMDISLKGYGLKMQVYNLWEKKYDTFQQGSLVLFNTPAFEKQWEGKNPMINWKNLNAAHQLKLIRQFDSDWMLYEIN